jgi:hypothetical protein
MVYIKRVSSKKEASLQKKRVKKDSPQKKARVMETSLASACACLSALLIFEDVFVCSLL